MDPVGVRATDALRIVSKTKYLSRSLPADARRRVLGTIVYALAIPTDKAECAALTELARVVTAGKGVGGIAEFYAPPVPTDLARPAAFHCPGCSSADCEALCTAGLADTDPTELVRVAADQPAGLVPAGCPARSGVCAGIRTGG